MSGSISNYGKDQRLANDYTEEVHKDDLLIFMAEKGVAFPTEMSRKLNMPFESINKIISHFVKLGFIKHILPNPDDPQPVFKGRIAEMWAMGVIGFGNINSRSWWILTLPGIEYVKAKYKGKELSIKGSLIKMYGLKYE